MAIDRTGISSLDAGASDITYSGDEGPKSPQQIAGGEYNRVLELLEKVRENIPLSEEEKMELQGLIQTLTAKGIDVETLIGEELTGGSEDMRMASADPMLQDEYDKYVFELQEMHPEAVPMTIEQFREQAISGMAEGGIARLGYRGGQLVQPGPGRPGYQGWSPGVAAEERRQRDLGSMRGGVGRDPVANIPTVAPEPAQRHHAVDTGEEESPYEIIGGTKVYLGDVEGKRIAEEKADFVGEPKGIIPQYIDKRAEAMYGMVPTFSWTHDKRRRFFNSLSLSQRRALGYNFNKDWDELTDTEKDILMSYDVYRDFNELGYQDWLKADKLEKFGPGEGPQEEWQRLGFPSEAAYLAMMPGGGGGGGGATAATTPATTTAATTYPAGWNPLYHIGGGATQAQIDYMTNVLGMAPGQTYMAQGGRVPAAFGGIMGGDGRRRYGLGSIWKKAKKFLKSDTGKMALMAAIGLGVPTMFGSLGKGATLADKGGWWKKALWNSKDKGLTGWGKAAIFGGLPLAGYLTAEEDEDDPYARDAELAKWSKQFEGLGQAAKPWYAAAQGGRIGAQEGGLMDMGGMEKDYRQEGGFVPIGGQERADDVPARLSKNEFVFTADAVRAAGGGDIDAGAEVMENVMENLEQGGQVSEESQGLEGARNMFATAQRLEGVL